MKGLTGPLRIDPHRAGKLAPSSVLSYKSAGKEFIAWLRLYRYEPVTGEEWDDLVVEYKNDPEVVLAKGKFANLIASVEFFFPNFNKLRVARSVLDAWNVAHPTKHTVPLGKGLGALVGIHMACMSEFRMGVGQRLQICRGLRPSELVNLLPADLAFPDEEGRSDGKILIRLGAKFGTKAKRE